MIDVGAFCDEFVVVRKGQHDGDPSEITINCPDKVGLGCDLARIVFEFGLTVIKGDMSSDGRWCFVTLRVVPKVRLLKVRWSLLKERLEDICPSAVPSLLPQQDRTVQSTRMLLLQVCSKDRTGLLNDVAQKLWELEFTIHKVKISTSPDGKAVNLFFVTDNSNKQPWKKRAEEVKEQLSELLGDTCTHCEINPAGPECGGLQFCPLPVSVTEDLLQEDGSPVEKDKSRGGQHANVRIDNSTSPVHSLLQVTCKSRKGLLYDCLRTMKDFNYQVADGRIAKLDNGNTEISIFIVGRDGRKITETSEQRSVCKLIKSEVEHPLRIKVVTRGPDTELLVATPIESCGKGRPRVLYDVTLALKMLDICIFKADIGRHNVNNRRWEIYRFLLVDKEELSTSSSSRFYNLLVERVRQSLMG